VSKQTPERAWGDALQGQKLWKVSACREHILQGTNSVERERGVTLRAAGTETLESQCL